MEVGEVALVLVIMGELPVEGVQITVIASTGCKTKCLSPWKSHESRPAAKVERMK
jgi:hypothetical protein